MSELHRIIVGTVTLIALFAVSLWASVVAQDVFDASTPGERSTQADANAPADSKVIETIRRALDDDSETLHSDDPILDDVLSIIRQQGSVLDGSALDQAVTDQTRPDAPMFDQRGEPKSDSDGDSLISVTDKAMAAERLLKAARFLEQVKPLDKVRIDLVRQMRRESIRLLSQ